MLTISNYKMQNTCFVSIVNIYMLLHIYILYSSWLCPGLPCLLCHSAGFHFPSISLVTWPRHAVAPRNRAFPRWDWTRICWKSMTFCSRSTVKARARRTRKPCTRHAWALLAAHTGAGSPAERAAVHCSGLRTAEGENHVLSLPTTTKPQKPKFGDAEGYSLKSSFYQSCFIFFNKTVLCKWLMIVRILPRAKCTVISLSYSVS